MTDLCKFWKDPSDPEKGTIWLYLKSEMMSFAGFSFWEEGIPFRYRGYRPQLIQARGVNWTATLADGTSHRFKATPQATKKVMADIAMRWKNPPEQLQKDKGRPFSVADLIEESHSHVYLVQLMTFDATADGRAYYKIGKAASVPKRIKQFGPCELIQEIRLSSEAMSLKAEARLHSQFEQYRKPGTEIFCLGRDELALVRAAFDALKHEP
jgi:hypothetical protein